MWYLYLPISIWSDIVVYRSAMRLDAADATERISRERWVGINRLMFWKNENTAVKSLIDTSFVDGIILIRKWSNSTTLSTVKFLYLPIQCSVTSSFRSLWIPSTTRTYKLWLVRWASWDRLTLCSLLQPIHLYGMYRYSRRREVSLYYIHLHHETQGTGLNLLQH